MLNVNVTLTFELMTPKSIGIIYGSWPFKIQRKVNLGKNKFEINERRRLLTPDRRTDRRMTCAIT